jgi:transposase
VIELKVEVAQLVDLFDHLTKVAHVVSRKITRNVRRIVERISEMRLFYHALYFKRNAPHETRIHTPQCRLCYAVRWLQRWIEEAQAPTIEGAAIVAVCLSALGGPQHVSAY